jgi:DNA repair protein RecO (recombination protein O)
VSLVTARAVLLRSHPYSESSRVLRFLTDSGGLVGVMARGVRRSGRSGSSGLDVFAQGALIYYMKETRELQTYKDFSVTHPRRGLGRDPARLAGASVLAELVLRHAQEGETQALFARMEGALDRLSEVPREGLLGLTVAEGWALVDTLGYRPELAHCVGCGRELDDDELARMDLEQGGLRCAACAGAGPRVGPVARRQLASLRAGEVPPDLTHERAHLRLLSDFVTYHLAGSRPLDAFRILVALTPGDDA